MIQTYTTRLVYKQELTLDIYLFRFRCENGQKVEYKAGQYLILMVPQTDGEMARRYYSIITPPNQNDYFDMVIEFFPNGVASEYLMKLHENSEIIFQGPAGVFIVKESSHNQVYLATGTGIAPIKSMIETQIKKSQPSVQTTLFWGVPMFKDVYFLEELKKIATSNPHFSFTICLSRESTLDMVPEADRKYFMLGRVTKGFDELLSAISYQPSATDFYVCGGRTVVEALRQYLYSKAIPKEAVHFEKF